MLLTSLNHFLLFDPHHRHSINQNDPNQIPLYGVTGSDHLFFPGELRIGRPFSYSIFTASASLVRSCASITFWGSSMV